LSFKNFIYFCEIIFENEFFMKMNYVYRQYDDYYVGHLIEFPEYETQGKTIEELEMMLKSLYKDLNAR